VIGRHYLENPAAPLGTRAAAQAGKTYALPTTEDKRGFSAST